VADADLKCGVVLKKAVVFLARSADMSDTRIRHTHLRFGNASSGFPEKIVSPSQRSLVEFVT
jgi:hypothetical protein